jgi:hypothetical protein
MTSDTPLLFMKLLPIFVHAVVLVLASGAQAMPTFVNGLALPATLLDLSGGTSVNTGRVGFFSDIYFDPNRREWWALSDRGPGGGTLDYATRVQRFTLDVNSSTGAISNFQIQQTVIFNSASGMPFNGIAPSPASRLGNSFDPEGIVVHPVTGNLIVSDEYGASVYEFTRAGNLVRQYVTPENIRPTTSPGVYNYDPDANSVGRRTNRGFEGLAISPDGRFAFAMLQSAMVNEGGGNGVFARIVKFETGTGLAVAQYAYRMEGSSQGRGISALVAINEHEFLVLERNNRGLGSGAELTPQNKKVFKIDIAGAADVSDVVLDNAFAGAAVKKIATPYLDLGADTLAALGGLVPEKWEGLTIGPRLDDGSFLMLAGTDNDYSVSQIAGSPTQYDVYFRPGTNERVQCDIGGFANCVVMNPNGSLGAAVTPGFTGNGFVLIPGVLHAYKATSADLVGYAAPVPEPETYALLLAGLGLIGWHAHRRHRG